ncbi:YbfB/YjiJ family MFS transporter [Oceanibacterium hippocampi]|uniref:Major Facilitator Superfamily protein n=1 Tax=Oceanibacterium hippocampi TaxID=745714 RepID=A0A1Y5SQN9_9PROT|nr:YbfB/YjiJ family MFS transporter [Oceanibacterium hippocampi]SLN46073.1 Major Facilitator Superfamily protein [Oceanibacterium hippocampi]
MIESATGGRARPLGIAIGGLLALAAAMGIGRFVHTPILPYMVAGLGLDEAQAGLLASANFLGYLLGAMAASIGRLPGGRRAWFLGGLLASALSTGAMGLVGSMPLFLSLRFIGGFASAFVLVFSSALVLHRLALAGRAGLSTVHFAGVGSGIALSAVLIAILGGAGLDWHVQWLASGALALLAFILVTRLVPDAPDGLPAAASAGAPAKVDRRLKALIAAYGLFGFGYVITATFLSTIVRVSPEIRALEPVVWLVVGLAAIPSVAFWAWIGRRHGNDRSFALACFAQAVGVVLSTVATSGIAVLLSAFLLGGTIMGLTAIGFIRAGELTTGDQRRVMAVMTAVFGVGQMIGPTFAGYAYRFTDSFTPPTLIAAAALVVAGLLVIVVRRPGS